MFGGRRLQLHDQQRGGASAVRTLRVVACQLRLSLAIRTGLFGRGALSLGPRFGSASQLRLLAGAASKSSMGAVCFEGFRPLRR